MQCIFCEGGRVKAPCLAPRGHLGRGGRGGSLTELWQNAGTGPILRNVIVMMNLTVFHSKLITTTWLYITYDHILAENHYLASQNVKIRSTSSFSWDKLTRQSTQAAQLTEAECWLVSSLLAKLATLSYGLSEMCAKISFKILDILIKGRNFVGASDIVEILFDWSP